MLYWKNIFLILKYAFLLTSIFGYGLCINRKFKIKKEFSLLVAVAIISIILVLAGILNILKYISFLIYLLGIVLFIYEFIKCDKRKLLTLNNFVMVVLLIYFAIIVSGMHIEHYDDFSHWAVIVKEMLQLDMLPNFESNLIMFKSYPPATACFIYFVCKTVGNTEYVMMLAQTLIILSASFVFLGIIDDKSKNKKIYFLLIVSLIMTLGNIYIGIVPYNELLVDVVLTLVGAAFTIILFTYRNDLKKLILFNMIFALFLMLIKNSGIYFVIINLLFTIYCILKNKLCIKKIEFIKIICVLIVIPILTMFIWKQHVKYVYGAEALQSKHSMSVSSYIKNFSEKSFAEITEVTKNYLKKVLNIKDISFKIMLFINLIMVLYCIYLCLKKNSKNFKENLIFLFIIDGIYLVYLMFLYFMYLVSMPAGEASSIGGYDRYVFTMSTYLLLLFLVKTLVDFQTYKNLILKITIVITIIFNLVLVVQNSNNHFLIGIDNYESGSRKKIDEAITNVKIDSNSKCVIYDQNFDFASGYMYYLGKYLLNTNYVLCTNDIDNIMLENIDYLIILEENYKVKAYIEKHNLQYFGGMVYKTNVVE